MIKSQLNVLSIKLNKNYSGILHGTRHDLIFLHNFDVLQFKQLSFIKAFIAVTR